MTLALLVLGCATNPWTAETAFEPTLNRLDLDGDGRVNQAEYDRVAFSARPFAQVDTDADGALSTGRVTKMWRVQGALRELTDAVWDTLMTTGFPSDATAEQRRKHISRMKQFVKPPAYPAFGRVRADPRGRIWINPYFDHLHWYVIDNAGSRISLVSLPLPEDQRPQLVGFADESVVIRHVDESGGAQLSFYRVETR